MTPDRIHEILVACPLPYTTDLDLTNGTLSMRIAGIIVRRVECSLERRRELR